MPRRRYDLSDAEGLKAIFEASPGNRHLSPDEAARYARNEERQERDRRAARATSLREQANVPVIFRGARLGDVSRLDGKPPREYAPLCDRLRRAVKNPFSLAMLGEWGTGKTELAMGLVHAFCLAGRSARYERLIDFFIDLKDAMGRAGVRAFLNRFNAYDLVVFDEITVRTDSSWDLVLFRNLLDDRHNGGKTTLLLGNAAESDMDELLGPALLRRMIQGGGGAYTLPWKPLKFRPRPLPQREDPADGPLPA